MPGIRRPASSASGERLPLQQLGVRAGGLDELVLVLVEQRRPPRACGSLLAPRRRPAISATIVCDAVGEQLALRVRRRAAQVDRAGGRAEVGHGLRQLAQAGAVVRPCPRPGRRRSGPARRHPRCANLLGVVGQQALGDELQQHVVVALEGDVDVEVGAQRRRSGSRRGSRRRRRPRAPPAGCRARARCDSGLSAAARVSRSWRSSSVSCAPREDVVELLQELARARRSAA